MIACLWHLSGMQYSDESGKPLWPRCVVKFFDVTTGEPVPAYRDSDLLDAFPGGVVNSDNNGMLPIVFFESEPFRLCEQRAETANGEIIPELSAIGLPIAAPRLSALQVRRLTEMEGA